ncbi:MAG: AAA family ATPase [Acetobacteraceae bacterium]|nr:AAA family ATPase [Acetobacteraceae bacterium]
MAVVFKKGSRRQVRLRMMISGPPKSGKSKTALRFAFALAPNHKVFVIEAGENDATDLYHGEEWDGVKWDWDICKLDSFSPESYIEAIQEAGRQGAEVIVIDSLSHEWNGKDGCLQIADQHGQFFGWKVATPLHDQLFQVIRKSPAHLIATCRSKISHVVESEGGKNVIRRIGMEPIQRESTPYEFDVLMDMDQNHIGTVYGSRCLAIEGKSCLKPGKEFLQPVLSWLETGVQVAPTAVSPRISDVQLERVAELLGLLGWTVDRISRDFPKRYGVTELAKLDQDQAGDLLKWLDAQAKAKGKRSQSGNANPAPAAAAVPAPAAETNGHAAPVPNGKPAASATPPAGPSEPVPAGATVPPALAGQRLTDAQIEQLKEAYKEWADRSFNQLRDEDLNRSDNEIEDLIKKEWLKLLAPYKDASGKSLTTAKGLTVAQAEEFIRQVTHQSELMTWQQDTTKGGTPATAGSKS